MNTRPPLSPRTVRGWVCAYKGVPLIATARRTRREVIDIYSGNPAGWRYLRRNGFSVVRCSITTEVPNGKD